MIALRPSILMTVTLLAFTAGTAHAASPEDGFRFGVKGAFGFGGELDVEVEGFTGSASDDLEPTLGFAVFGLYPLHRHFQIGLQAGFGWMNTESGADANLDRWTVIDISPVLKARLPLMNDTLEVYALMPFGLTVSMPGDDVGIDNGFGWNIGLQFGASYLVTDAVGLLAELGWQGRSTTNTGTDSSVDATFTMHQLAVNVGAYVIF